MAERQAAALWVGMLTILLVPPPAQGAGTLKVAGSTAPGGTAVVAIGGTAGAPSLLLVAFGFLDPPVPLGGGSFALDLALPFFAVGLGPLPASGEIALPAVIPPGPGIVGAVVHLQAAAPGITNAVSIRVNESETPLVGAAAGDGFGSMVIAGDWNADGFDDVAISAVVANTVSVFYGPSLTPGPVLANPDPIPQAQSLFGTSLAAGDFDFDGALDLAVGAPGQGPVSADNTGRAWIFRGPSLGQVIGLGPVPAAPNSGFGTALAAGDFDGDGKDDLAVGVPGAQVVGAFLAGQVAVYAGPSQSLLATLKEPQPETLAAFGGALAAGDVDLDGDDDLVVGVPNAKVGPVSGAGEAWLFKGPLTAAPIRFIDPLATPGTAFACRLAVADVTGGPEPDVLVGSPGGFGTLGGNPSAIPNVGEVEVYVDADPLNVRVLDDPTQEFFQHFGMDVNAADFDGDGRADLLVGSFLADLPGAPDSGTVFVFRGGTLHQRFDVTAPDLAPGIQFGVFTCGADLDGDGRSELVVGAPYADPGGAADVGVVWVIR